MMKIFLMLFFCTFAFAWAPENEFTESLLRLEQALEAQDFLSLNLIRVRFGLEGGIEIPYVSKFSVNPEVELYFVEN